ncbi:hypothetical protein BGZ58_001304 [Dissophora ornata]|nr:hypothetical protein BGZ58_001304 [Dissophora ornata]
MKVITAITIAALSLSSAIAIAEAAPVNIVVPPSGSNPCRNINDPVVSKRDLSLPICPTAEAIIPVLTPGGNPCKNINDPVVSKRGLNCPLQNYVIGAC